MTEKFENLGQHKQDLYHKRLTLLQSVNENFGRRGMFAVGMICGFLDVLHEPPFSQTTLLLLEHVNRYLVLESVMGTRPQSRDECVDILINSFQEAFVRSVLAQDGLSSDPINEIHSGGYSLEIVKMLPGKKQNDVDDAFNTDFPLIILGRKNSDGERNYLIFGSKHNYDRYRTYRTVLGKDDLQRLEYAYHQESIGFHTIKRITVARSV